MRFEHVVDLFAVGVRDLHTAEAAAALAAALKRRLTLLNHDVTERGSARSRAAVPARARARAGLRASPAAPSPPPPSPFPGPPSPPGFARFPPFPPWRPFPPPRGRH